MTAIGSFLKERPVFSVQRRSTVLRAAQYMAEKNIGAVAVLDGARLVGIFSERDVIIRVIAKELDPKTIPVEDVMTVSLVVADEEETDEACLRKMKAANCRHLPIVSGDTLIGLVSLRDLLQVELTERDEKLDFLTGYMFHVPPDSGAGSKT